MIPLLLGYVLAGSKVHDAWSLGGGITLGAVVFSALGVLMAARPTNTPSEIMMLSNLVRLPLIFISGVFVPLQEMPPWAQYLAPLSPLSYVADLIRVGMGGGHYFSPAVDFAALSLFASALMVFAVRLHRGAQAKVQCAF